MEIIESNASFISETGITEYFLKRAINKEYLSKYYSDYKKYNKDFKYLVDYQWFRIYNKEMESKLESADIDLEKVFRIYLNPKRSKLIEILNFILPLFYGKTHDILSVKVWNLEYTEDKLPIDNESDDRINMPVIVIYLSNNKLTFDTLKDLLQSRFTPYNDYVSAKVDIGKKRTKINDLIYWSDYTTTKIGGNYYDKYLKYKNKYINLKNHIFEIGGSEKVSSFIKDIKINDIIKIFREGYWTNYKYIGLISRDYYLDGTRKVYFTDNTHTIIEGKVYPKYFLNEDGSLTERGKRTNFIYTAKENVHIFVNYDEEKEDYIENHYNIYVSDLNELRLYDNVRKEDGSIFDDFIPDSRTKSGLNHYNYNFYLYPSVEIVDITTIKPGRYEDSLNASRTKSIAKIKDDPNILLPPIKLNKEGIIQDGHHRYYKSIELGFTHIPVIKL